MQVAVAERRSDLEPAVSPLPFKIVVFPLENDGRK